MKIAVVHPSPVPFTRGGAERATTGIQAAINDLTLHEAEMIKIPVDERTLPGVLEAYETYANLNLDHFDRIVVSKYPAWMVDHPYKVLLMMHPLRGVYDTYQYHDQPLTVPNPSPDVFAMLHLMEQSHHRGALDEFFERWHNALAHLGPHHPDFVFPGPFARTAVRWLDSIAMAPGAVKRYLSQSATVAAREGYFPRSVTPKIVHLPGQLPAAPRNDDHGSYLFTASRLDGPKRLDLLVDAMAYVPGRTELRIAGTGAMRAQLEVQAADDPRIKFLGFVRDDELPELYANALAVPFIPADEDLGLITLEAFSEGTAVVTCTDSGGPTEFIKHGVNGLIAEPTAASIGAALASLVTDPELARQIGAAGKERGDRITWDLVIEAVLGEAVRTPEELTAEALAAAADHDVQPSRRRVVVLTTFPINNPGHGGQLRARNLYGSLARWRPVHVVALVDFGNQAAEQTLAPGLTQSVVPRSAAQHLAGEELSAEARMPVTDVTAGTHIELTPDYLAAVASAADGASAIILAEPYLLPAIEQLGLDLPVIYDAYNVEAQLKAGIFPDTELGRDLLAQVVDVERRAVVRAARTTTCSATDADALAAAADQDRDRLTPIPNGTTIPAVIASPEQRRAQGEQWRRRYWTAGSMGAAPEHLAVFFGSWHPPNLDAAELLIELAPQLPNVLILSVGHHGQAFEQRVVPRNLIFPGTVTTRAKDRLLATADVALNPMRLGSGTNLKLLEYLAVDIPVVSTPFGARGIDVIDGEHLRFAEPQAFAAAVVEVLADSAGAQKRAAAARALVSERYSWDHLGAQLAQVVGEVVPAEARK